MAPTSTFNTNSLNMVKGEVAASLQRAELGFESYLAEPEAAANFDEIIDEMERVRGTFKLIELAGVDLLAGEVAELFRALQAGVIGVDERLVMAASSAFMLFPRYLELVSSRQQVSPVLLQDAINELRAARRKPPLPEAFFHAGELPSVAGLCVIGALDPAVFRPLKHMFQVGLLGVLRNRALPSSYSLMERALQRIVDTQPAAGAFSQLLLGVVESLASGGLALTFSRRRLLGNAERALKAGSIPSDELCRDMCYLVALSDSSGAAVDALRGRLGMRVLPQGDGLIRSESKRLLGPQEALAALAVSLKEEIHGLKESLEVSGQELASDEVVKGLAPGLKKVADILTVIELPGPAAILRAYQMELEALSQGQPLAPALVQRVASSLLFVEHVLDRLASFSDRHAEGDVDIDQEQQVAHSELQQARLLAIREAQLGLGVAKRAISGYVDSNFDPIHIANVAMTLSGVRGALAILGYSRAAAILKACSDYINARMQRAVAPVTQKQWLDTLADALISVEYYVDELASRDSAEEKVLEVAEESLAALGYPSGFGGS